MARRNHKFILGDMSAEEINELMEAVESDTYSDYDSDDSFGDPNYIPDEIEAEVNDGINAAINEMNAGETSDSFLPSTVVAARTSKRKKRARSPLPTIEPEGPLFTPDDGGLIGSANEIKKKFEKILWVKKSLQYHVNQVAFQGNSCLPDEVKSLGTPFQLFRYFFNDNIIQIIVKETNRAAVGERFSVNANDILQYLGILLYMSVYKYPNLESYWGKNAFVPIQRTMPWKRFYAIKRYLCFQNESERRRKGEPGYDPLFRIRNLANELCKRFDSIPKTARLCVDEQMCSTKTNHHLRQYMPAKPHKWGVKFFVLCDSNGFAYKFEIYNGAGDNVLLPNTPDLGATANVVLRLSQSVPDFKNHIIYFDNFYTSIPLLVYLRSRGIYSLGTVRSNRITDCKLPSEREVKTKPRGYSVEYMANVKGIDVNAVLWKDNNCVRLLSTYVGIEPFRRISSADQPRAKASRYDRSKKSFIDIDCPQIIQEYNAHMGGVDLMDGLMGRYHIRAKTKNVMTRIFYHLIDMAVTNSYILYHRVVAERKNEVSDYTKKSEQEKPIQLPSFRSQIAEALTENRRGSGRPSSRPESPAPQSPSPAPTSLFLKSGQKAHHPVEDIRYDGFGHMSAWLPKIGGKKQCKHCKTSETQHICTKCNLHLCNSFAKNCFADYHERR